MSGSRYYVGNCLKSESSSGKGKAQSDLGHSSLNRPFLTKDALVQEQGGMLPGALSHSKLQLEADYRFFFKKKKKKTKADADWDLPEHTTFADSWKTAALQDAVISSRIPSSHRSDGNRRNHHVQSAHS